MVSVEPFGIDPSTVEVVLGACRKFSVLPGVLVVLLAGQDDAVDDVPVEVLVVAVDVVRGIVNDMAWSYRGNIVPCKCFANPWVYGLFA
jgi:hypothetical protein